MADLVRAVVSADEFQFVVADGSGGELTGGSGDGALVMFGDVDVPFIVIFTGEHWGPVEVSGASYECEPPVEAGWEDVVELSVRCSAGLFAGPLDEEPVLPLVNEGGVYRVRVNACGRDAGAALSYREMNRRRREPIERFLIEVWPESESDTVVVRMTSEVGRSVGRSGGEAPEVVLEHEDAGRAASDALRVDLDGAPGARKLSGGLAIATASRGFPATRRALFSGFAHPHGWMTKLGGGAALKVGNPFGMNGGGIRDGWYDVFTGSDGEIRCTWLEIASPRYVEFAWNWYTKQFESSRNSPGRAPFLTDDSIVSIKLDLPARNIEPKMTPVTVTHAKLPIEWVADLTAFWTWQLERADRVFKLGHN